MEGPGSHDAQAPSRFPWLPTLLLLVLVVVPIWIWKSRSPEVWFSDPLATRPANGKHPLVGETTSFLPDLTERPVEISNGVHEVSLRIASGGEPEWSGFSPVEEKRLTPGQGVRLGEIELNLSHVTLGWEAAPDENPESEFGPLLPHAFDAFLNPLSEQEWKDRAREIRASASLHGRKNSLNLEWTLGIQSPADHEMLVLSCWMEDARTGRTVTTGYGSQVGSSSMNLSFRLNTWNTGPVELVMDVAHGKPSVHRLDTQPGSLWSGGNLAVRLLHLQDGDQRGFSSGTRGDHEEVWVRWDEISEKRQECFSIWWVSPSAWQVPLSWRALDHEGKVVGGGGGGSSGRMKVQSFAALVKDLDHFEILEYPTLHRVRLRLPFLPGLLEENRSVTNLFDLKVPFFEGDYWALRTSVENLLQMKLQGFSPRQGVAATQAWKLQVRDTTARDLLVELLQATAPAPGKTTSLEPLMEVRSETHVIQVVPPWSETIWSTIQETVRKWFR